MSKTPGVCQSCGMPLLSQTDYGTEADGTSSSQYCHYCYQKGAYTDPNATVDQMAEKAGAIMTQMFAMPPDKAKEFSKMQIQNLYRWSGKIIPSCESCGMPLISDQDAGTETDGTRSLRYCTHCYQNGAFTEPDLTRETMVKKYAPMLASQYGMPIAKAEEMVERFTGTLSRWQ
ncbi:MAG: zinc ribbon domain-containing protein [Methanospirillum sp.]|uniref:zinc ribbon domain-containing protein n=1 Tax=Methanospirillum sp. TaxID=45200 RepID=UPI00236A6E96|nr:zinc ribbon domain-containing protein [Methanospirillum sp.]MDD1728320.1 zinc ribbon domain-containing protein [Methanospirillum sp.]